MRQYLVGSWNNADSYDYSGEQLVGSRVGASSEVPHMVNGKANLDKYGDNTEKKKSSLSIQDKILPQARRVERLTEQLRELVDVYQKGNIDIDEYSMLLSVLANKRSRAEILLAKAKSVRAPFEIEEEEAISLGKTHVKSEKSFKTSKRIDTEGDRFEGVKKPKNDNSNFLSKALDFLAKNDWAVFMGSSTLLFTAVKIIF